MVFFMKYRKKIEVIADILSVTRKGAKKTHIMYRGNLSFKLLNKYLDIVTKAGFIYFKNEDRCYLLTEKGKIFLERFKNCRTRTRDLEKHLKHMKNEITLLEQMYLRKD